MSFDGRQARAAGCWVGPMRLLLHFEWITIMITEQPDPWQPQSNRRYAVGGNTTETATKRHAGQLRLPSISRENTPGSDTVVIDE